MDTSQSVEDNVGRSKKLNRFIAKTYSIVNSDEPSACWVHGGKSFVILDPKKFSKTVLPKYFKHNKLTSFVRQLNFYGFHKIRIDPSALMTSENIDSKGGGDKETMTKNDIVCFQHKFFQANQPKLLQNIQRATKQSGATVVTESPLPTHQKELERIQSQLLEMTRRTDSLCEEFEMKLAAARIELEVDYLRRIKALEVCYKDLLVLNLVNRDSMAFTLPGQNKTVVDSVPMVTRSFPPPPQGSSSSSSNGSSRTTLQENHGRKALFGNVAPWSDKAFSDKAFSDKAFSDKAFNDISVRFSLNQPLVTGKGKMLNSTLTGGIKTNFKTGLRA